MKRAKWATSWFVGLCAVFTGLITSQAADFSAWAKKMPVQFNGYTRSDPLTNFPALVVLSTNISGFSYADLLSTNADLRFTDSTQTNELNYEVESWDTNGSSFVWVQVQRLTNNASLYAFWGKSAQAVPPYATNGMTWEGTFRGAWHLKERSGTAVSDSTSNRVTGTATSGVLMDAVGLADGADDFDGIDDYTTMGDVAALETMGALTFECWANLDVMPATGKWVGAGKESAYRFVVSPDGSGTFVLATGGASWYGAGTTANWPAGSVVTGAWTYLVGT